MKYFKDENNNVYAYSKDGSQDKFIKEGLTPIKDAEMKKLTAPKPLTAKEKKEIAFQEFKEKKLREEFEAGLK